MRPSNTSEARGRRCGDAHIGLRQHRLHAPTRVQSQLRNSQENQAPPAAHRSPAWLHLCRTLRRQQLSTTTGRPGSLLWRLVRCKEYKPLAQDLDKKQWPSQCREVLLVEPKRSLKAGQQPAAAAKAVAA